ncbi:3-dehydroquinate synthase II [Paenibacillus sp. TRM 82003]|nr:3-dehydroquinate synthase II [Paenibacillus sp. TRM 82003]
MSNGYGKGHYLTIRAVKEVGTGARVCLDFVDFLGPDEGLYVGNTGHGYALLLAETRSTSTYPPRPFRVNCGAIHQYVWVGEKTVYLSEIQPGDCLTLFTPTTSRDVSVGRVKIEHRPLLRIELESEDGTGVSFTVQASESVHLLGNGGEAKQAIHLKVGDQVLAAEDEPGRHLGTKIQEVIHEY